jgi:hypothetical protein
MSGPRYVVLGLADVRATWFRAVAQWAHAGAIAAEFVKCVSIEEARARLSGGRPYSALLADARAVDRDLIAAADAIGCAVLVVGRCAIAVTAELEPTFTRAELADALATRARPIERPDRAPQPERMSPVGWRGKLVAVTGPGGTGSSTISMAVAEGLARHGAVLLADLCRDAELAMLHDAREVVPGVQELVDGFRIGTLDPSAVRALTFEVPERGYDLLLGLRRSRAWTALRPRAFEAALDALLRSYATVVADVDCDLEGEEDGGSVDVEERNVMARTACASADIVLVVGLGGIKGVHSLTRVVTSLLAFGVPGARVVPLVNRAPRNPRARAELTKAFTELLPEWATLGVVGPLFVPHRHVEDAMRLGLRLPPGLREGLVEAVHAVGERAPFDARRPAAPQRVSAGSVGSWLPVMD